MLNSQSVWVEDTFDVATRKQVEWTPFNGFDKERKALLESEDAKYAGKVIKIGIVPQEPRLRIRDAEPGDKLDQKRKEKTCGDRVIEGVTYDIVKMLQERMNFTVEWDCSTTELGIVARTTTNGHE